MACKKQTKKEVESKNEPTPKKKTTTKIAVLEVKEQPKTTKKVVKKAVKIAETKSDSKQVTAKKDIVKKVVKSVVDKKEVKSTPKKTVKKVATSESTKETKPIKTEDSKKVYLTNVRIGAIDKTRLQSEAQKRKMSLQAYVIMLIEARLGGEQNKKMLMRHKGSLDSVLACRLTKDIKDRLVDAALKENQTISTYVLNSLFGKY